MHFWKLSGLNSKATVVVAFLVLRKRRGALNSMVRYRLEVTAGTKFGPTHAEGYMPEQQRASLTRSSEDVGTMSSHPTLRLIHHQACTGGTLIARCLGALPRVAVISEVSPAATPQPVRFDPVSPLGLLFNAYPGLRPPVDDLALIIGRQLLEAQDLLAARKRVLVVRSHDHSDWMAPGAPCRPTLRPALALFGQVHGIVTVRHPFASYAALVRNKWHAGVHSYADYCARYAAFLAAHPDAPRFRYEAFCRHPGQELARMAEALALPGSAELPMLWHKLRLTGHSGRAAAEEVIRPLPFELWTAETEAVLRDLPEHRDLCRQMGYPTSLAVFAEAENLAALLAQPHDPVPQQALERLAAWQAMQRTRHRQPRTRRR